MENSVDFIIVWCSGLVRLWRVMQSQPFEYHFPLFSVIQFPKIVL